MVVSASPREWLMRVAATAVLPNRSRSGSNLQRLAVQFVPTEAQCERTRWTWARRVHEAVSTSKTAASGPFRLGDLVVPFKAKSPKPSVVSQVLHGKTGVVDLDRLTHKQFTDGWLAPVELPPLGTSVGE